MIEFRRGLKDLYKGIIIYPENKMIRKFHCVHTLHRMRLQFSRVSASPRYSNFVL